MAELGPGQLAYHRQVGAVAARAGVAALVAVGPLARGYLAGARGVPETHYRAPTLTPGLAALRAVVRSGDRVLVKGSRVMGLEAVADALVVTYV